MSHSEPKNDQDQRVKEASFGLLFFSGNLSYDRTDRTKSIGTRYQGLNVTSHSVVIQLYLKRFLRFFRDVQTHIEAAF